MATGESTQSDIKKPRTPRFSRWFRSRNVVLAGGTGLLVLILALPTLLSTAPFRRVVLSRVAGDIDGSITAQDLRLRRFSPPRVEELRIESADGTPVLTVPSCTGDTSLWKQFFAGGNLGQFIVDRPQMYFVLDAQGVSNLSKTFVGDRDGNDSSTKRARELAAKVASQLTAYGQIVDGTLVFQAGPDEQEWTLGDLNVTGGLQRDYGTGTSTVHVESGTLLDHLDLTPSICNDLMKFAAPILADVSWAEGKFSLECEETALPLNEPAAGYVQGTLTVHSVRVGPGPLAIEILGALGLRGSVQLVDNSQVRFTMSERRVHHEGLRFQLGELNVTTSGYVGLDESLDLVAAIQIPELAEDAGPVRRVLSGRTVELPVRGTLKHPDLVEEAILEEGTRLLTELLPELADNNEDALREFLERFAAARHERRHDESSDSAGEDVTQPRMIGEGRLLDLLRGALERDLEDPGNGEDGRESSEERAASPTDRPRPLLRLLDRVRGDR